MTRAALLGLIFIVQGICAAFFVYDIFSPILGLRSTPINWQLREIIEICAALGLLLGFGLGGWALRQSLRRSARAEESLRVVQGAFAEHLQAQFDAWALTPAERDVALFSLKGFTIQEIADLRNTSEGTVKAQSNAIYRKAGVSSRAQLLSYFMEDFIGRSSVADAKGHAGEARAGS